MEIVDTEPEDFDADSIEGDTREEESARPNDGSDTEVEEIGSAQEEKVLQPAKRKQGRPLSTGEYANYRLVGEREERERGRRKRT